MKAAHALVAGTCLATFSCASLAAETWHTSTIKNIYPQGDGTFVIIFNTNAATCTNANPSKYHYVAPSQNGVTDEGAKKIYAAVLFAAANDKVVTIAYDDATVYCYVNRLIF